MPVTTPRPDVIIIGAGVIGLASAHVLLGAGLRVRVYERGRMGPGGASWAGGGILAPLEPALLDACQGALLGESLALYPDWCAALADESGIDPEYTVSGLRVMDAEPGPWINWARSAGQAISAHVDGVTLPGIAQVRSPRLLRALAAAVRRRGGEIVEERPVLRLVGAEHMTGVETADGVQSASHVLLCAGAWSAALCAAAAVEPVKGEMLLFEAQPGELGPILMQDGMYLIPRRDGRIVAGSTLESCGFEAAPSARGRQRILDAVRRLWPQLLQRPLIGHWAGLRPAPLAGGGPLIARVRDRPGLLLNCGHHRLGITLAPGSARRVLALI